MSKKPVLTYIQSRAVLTMQRFGNLYRERYYWLPLSGSTTAIGVHTTTMRSLERLGIVEPANHRGKNVIEYKLKNNDY